jgi:hypothetical protein
MHGWFALAQPFPLRMGHGLLHNLSHKALFELKEAPLLGEPLAPPIQPDREEMGQDGQGHRVRDRSASLVTCIWPKCNLLLLSEALET